MDERAALEGIEREMRALGQAVILVCAAFLLALQLDTMFTFAAKTFPGDTPGSWSWEGDVYILIPFTLFVCTGIIIGISLVWGAARKNPLRYPQNNRSK